MTPQFVQATGIPSQAIGESDRPPGEGHGMSRNREPKRNKGLPHDRAGSERQPYSREVEDYSGDRGEPPVPQTAPQKSRRH